MTYQLYSRTEDKGLYISMPDWIKLLALARRYGWQPQGTVLSNSHKEFYGEQMLDIDSWEGNYITYSSQEVTDEDALAIANALEAALKDIPDKQTPEVDINNDYIDLDQDFSFVQLLDAGVEYFDNNLLYFFSGSRKEMVGVTIALCRIGGFVIR